MMMMQSNNKSTWIIEEAIREKKLDLVRAPKDQ